jgi:hypothetical protein
MERSYSHRSLLHVIADLPQSFHLYTPVRSFRRYGLPGVTFACHQIAHLGQGPRQIIQGGGKAGMPFQHAAVSRRHKRILLSKVALN